MNTKTTTTGQDRIYQMVTDQIIKKLEEGTIPWQMPWNGTVNEPKNFINKKAYRGINVFLLTMACRSTPYWVSFKQAKKKGGSVKKGEKGFPVIFWKWIKKEKADGTEDTFPVVRYYTVFNLDQCDGIELPDADKPDTIDFNPIDAADQIIDNMPKRPEIDHAQPAAFYMPSRDMVNMPKPEVFHSAEEYYSTLFHELTHSTGHKSRLDRHKEQKNHMFGSKDYSKEELIAEMGAAYLCGTTGIENKTIDNSAAYIKSWLRKLQDDPKMVIQAAAKAQKAVDFILDRKFQ